MLAVAIPSSPLVAVVVGVVLFVAGRPIIQRVAAAEMKPWLVNVMTVSLVLHLAAAEAQIFVTDHFYHGIADWLRYDNQGAGLAVGFRHFNFSLAPGHLGGIVNNGSVSIAAAIVFTLVGTNQLAAFMVFSWLAFCGTIMFFRAFSLTFAGADTRRYAYLLFFFPSLIFWTADVSKEAIMILSLGMTAYGGAKVLARRRGGFVLIVIGGALGILIRPNEFIVLMAGFTLAMMVQPSGARRNLGGIRRAAGTVFLGGLLGLSVFLTLKYLHTANGTLSLQATAANNSGTGAGFGSGGVPYSSNIITWPRDLYVILFDPLPFNFHGFGELIAAFENTFILGVVLASLRHLKIVPRTAFARPYVMMCAFYTFGFIYAFAALGNLGLITRERTMLLPFLLVLLCIPRAPRHEKPRYEWELRRKDRLRFRNAQAARRGAVPSPLLTTAGPSPAGGGRGRPAGAGRAPPSSGRRRPRG